MSTVHSRSNGGNLPTPKRSTMLPARVAAGVVLPSFLIVLAVMGASALHGAGTSQLRRGPASILLSVLITLAGLAGIASLALLFWGLVTRHRRSLDSSEAQRHSPILAAGGLLAVFAGLTFLAALAAHQRHVQPPLGLREGALSPGTSTVNSLPLNAAASFTTSGLVVGIVVVLILTRLVHSMGWRRALHRFRPVGSEADTAQVFEFTGSEPDALSSQLDGLFVPDPGIEPDPRRAVIACYLQLLDIGSRHGPERRTSETPAEYLRRMLVVTAAAATPAISLTGLFERARYSRQPVNESMRYDAIAALGALKNTLPVRTIR